MIATGATTSPRYYITHYLAPSCYTHHLASHMTHLPHLPRATLAGRVKVMSACPGVVAVRTPQGLQWGEWMRGLTDYQARHGDARHCKP
jgi:hypothetical protein